MLREYRYTGFITFLLCILMLACNPDETSHDAFVELKRIDAPDGSKSILYYQYASEAADTNTALVLVLQKDEKIDLRRQSYFSYIDMDTIYWLTKDTIVIVEKYLNYLNKGRSNYKDSIYPMNGAIVKIARVDPVDSTFIREELFRQSSPGGQQKVVVFRYVKPQSNFSILNISILGNESEETRYGNFYVGRGDFDCIRDIRWDSIGDFTIRASKRCYYGFDEYLVKTRPMVKYKLVLSEEQENKAFMQPADTLE